MGLRNRIAEYSNKTAAKKCGPKKKMKKTSILDVTFCGYRCENDEGMILYMQKISLIILKMLHQMILIIL